MELLKERILKDGIVIMPNVLRVDSFLNHQIDCTLYRQIAKEFKERYKDTKINKILTIEASGIGIALATAFELGDVPVVFAKKGTAKTIYCFSDLQEQKATRLHALVLFSSR